jgi:hypothetical protein
MPMAKCIYKVSHAMRDAVKFRVKRFSQKPTRIKSDSTTLGCATESAKPKAKSQNHEVNLPVRHNLIVDPMIQQHPSKFYV